MRKLLTFTIWLFAITFLSSQVEVKKIEYGISLLPHFGTLMGGEGRSKSLLSFGYGIEPGLRVSIAKNLQLHAGLNFQKTKLAQRFNNFQWPDDNENGQWVPWKSHEQYEVEYYTLGFTAGANLKLSQTPNYWAITAAGAVRQVFNEMDKLIINESGNPREYNSDEIDTELNKTQLFIGGGFSYNGSRFSVGPLIEYGLTDLLAENRGTAIWSFEGGRPVIIYLRVSYFI